MKHIMQLLFCGLPQLSCNRTAGCHLRSHCTSASDARWNRHHHSLSKVEVMGRTMSGIWANSTLWARPQMTKNR